ncbi:MAG: hypothetical protein EVA87_07265 [Rhodospirillaceae bacterium]|nr:MAG: hypothetical protein EVA87_07265 [Rhodospirillaceae bacterium]
MVAVIGCVNAVLAVGSGKGIGAISNRFLDHYTPFDYFPRISLQATLCMHALCIYALCVFTSIASSIYPVFVANHTSHAESPHYQ